MTEYGKSPLLSVEELAHTGYAAVLFPATLFRVAMKAMEAATALLAVEGSQRELLDMMQTREELYDLLDYQGFEERDRAHFGGRVDK
jgi:methylisocitrate lyase